MTIQWLYGVQGVCAQSCHAILAWIFSLLLPDLELTPNIAYSWNHDLTVLVPLGLPTCECPTEDDDSSSPDEEYASTY
jgi:hypothetical protein